LGVLSTAFVNNFTYFDVEKMIRYIITLIFLTINMAASAEQIAEPKISLVNVIKGYSDQRAFGNPTGIFLDPIKNEIYIADAGNHQIGIFDNRGNSLWTFKHWVTDSHSESARTLGDPHSVVVTKTGDIIVSDNKADYIDIFDYRGTLQLKISPEDYPETGPFRGAILALDKAGNLYIGTILDKSEILILDSDYQIIKRFGSKGDEPQNFQNISGIWVSDDGNILVTDALGTPILKKFNPNGEYLGGFGEHSIEKNDFSLPCGVVMTSNGRIWIVDQLRQIVKCVNDSGAYITMIGGFGNAPGDMCYPSGAASDGDSTLVVVEKNGNRFQRFIIR
jgi:tripartite motif-containing protein 71